MYLMYLEIGWLAEGAMNERMKECTKLYFIHLIYRKLLLYSIKSVQTVR